MKPKHELWTDIEQEWEAAWAKAHPEIRHDFANPEEQKKYDAENGIVPMTDQTPPLTLTQELSQYLFRFSYPEDYGVSREQVETRIERHKSLIVSGTFLDEFEDLFKRAIRISDERRDIDILDYSLVHVAGAQLAYECQCIALGRIHMATAMHFWGRFSDVLDERRQQNGSPEIYHNDDVREVLNPHDQYISIKIHLGELVHTRRPDGGWKTVADVANHLSEEIVAFVKKENDEGRAINISTDETDMAYNIEKWVKKYEILWRTYTNRDFYFPNRAILFALRLTR